jgi:hypothetical protein
VNFNLREEESDNNCHPSPFGYLTIAKYLAELMRTSNVWPAL